jgi:probable rRNA maturation factor
VKIIIKNFQKKIPVSPKRIKRAILKVFSQEGLKKSGEITICFVNDKKIRELNLKYLRKNKATDVLAFDMSVPLDKGRMFADIIISADTAMRNAAIFKSTPSEELKLYAVHGTLHLLGYDDRTRRQRELMRKKEEYYVDTQD